MPYGPDKVRLTVAVDQDLNDKLEKFSKAMHLSKTALVINLIEQNIDNYARVWNLVSDPEQLDKLIVAMNRQHKDTSALKNIRKQIKANPKLKEDTNALFKDIATKKR